MEFYERMRELRKERKETQRQVADAIGVTDRQYQRFETGVNLPGFENLVGIADHFGVSLGYLAGRGARWVMWRRVARRSEGAGPEGNVEAVSPRSEEPAPAGGVQPFHKAGHCECSFLQTTFKLFAERIYHDF